MNIKFNESVLNTAASILEIKSAALKKLIIKYNKFYVNSPKSFINKDLIKINYNKFKIQVFVKTGEIEIMLAQKNISSESNEFTFKKIIMNSLLRNKLLITDFFIFYQKHTLKEKNNFNLYLKININEKKETIKIFKEVVFVLFDYNFFNTKLNNDYFDYSNFDFLIFESNSEGNYKSEVINAFKIKYDINNCSIQSLIQFYDIINY